ncbi:MAG: hypothetical protein CRN43_14360 [Candidatus Nephrothrix sp. EaCA]|nr:MAG: hypothetical protein CRN43_14360 [Candidatus Nephrothrix sp. EaCA]
MISHTEPICEPGFFRCDNYRCIPSTFICDGKYDCGPHDKSDEKHCSTTAGQIISIVQAGFLLY